MKIYMCACVCVCVINSKEEHTGESRAQMISEMHCINREEYKI